MARKTWRTLEPIHGMIYFVPEAEECYARLGLRGGRMGYFASRAAAMGAVPAEVVIATFYNFSPGLVRRCIPEAWSLAAPADITRARFEAVDLSLRRGLGEEALESAEMAEAADLARRAARAAAEDLHGRPLFAAHASLEWPTSPHLVLWHAQTLLREYRGDAHIAALLLAGLDPVEALVTHAAVGEVPVDVLRATRAWSGAEWDAGCERLRLRGLITDTTQPTFTEAGWSLRKRIEDQTDVSSLPPYEALGEEACTRLRALVRPLSQAVVAAGLLMPDPSKFGDPER